MTFDVSGSSKVLRKTEIWEKQSAARCDWLAEKEERLVIESTEPLIFSSSLVSHGKTFDFFHSKSFRVEFFKSSLWIKNYWKILTFAPLFPWPSTCVWNSKGTPSTILPSDETLSLESNQLKPYGCFILNNLNSCRLPCVFEAFPVRPHPPQCLVESSFYGPVQMPLMDRPKNDIHLLLLLIFFHFFPASPPSSGRKVTAEIWPRGRWCHLSINWQLPTDAPVALAVYRHGHRQCSYHNVF